MVKGGTVGVSVTAFLCFLTVCLAEQSSSSHSAPSVEGSTRSSGISSKPEQQAPSSSNSGDGEGHGGGGASPTSYGSSSSLLSSGVLSSYSGNNLASSSVSSSAVSSSYSGPCTPCSIAEDCSDRATSVSGCKETRCVCDCLNAYERETGCATCPSPNYDQNPNTLCSRCNEPLYTDPSLGCPRICTVTPNCTSARHAVPPVIGNSVVGCKCTCRNYYFGKTCENCPTAYDALNSDCLTCAPGYQYRPDTTICDKTCTQANCSYRASSVSGFQGGNCTCQCRQPYQGTQCEICPPAYNCEFAVCAAGYKGRWPTCEICSNAANCSFHSSSQTWLGPGDCQCTCRNQWYGDKCQFCPPAYDPAQDCGACSLPDFPYGTYPNCIIGCTSRNNCSNHASAAVGNPNISCTCTCRGNWTGNKCQTCPEEYDPFRDCSECKPGFTDYPNCTTPETPAPTTSSSTGGTSSSSLGSSPQGGSSLMSSQQQPPPPPDSLSTSSAVLPTSDSSGDQQPNREGSSRSSYTPGAPGSTLSGSSDEFVLSSQQHSTILVSGSSSGGSSDMMSDTSSSSSSHAPPASSSSVGGSSSSMVSSDTSSSSSVRSSTSSSSSSDEPECEPWINQDWDTNCTTCKDPYDWYPFCYYMTYISGNWSVDYNDQVSIAKLLENGLMESLSDDLNEFINTTSERCGIVREGGGEEQWAWNSTFVVRDWPERKEFMFAIDFTDYNWQVANSTADCLLEQLQNRSWASYSLTNTSALVNTLFGPAAVFTLGDLLDLQSQVQELSPCAPDPICDVGTADMKDWAAAFPDEDDKPADESPSLAWVAVVVILLLLIIGGLGYYFLVYRYKAKNEKQKVARYDYSVDERKLDDMEVAFCNSEMEAQPRTATRTQSRFKLDEVFANSGTEMTLSPGEAAPKESFALDSAEDKQRGREESLIVDQRSRGPSVMFKDEDVERARADSVMVKPRARKDSMFSGGDPMLPLSDSEEDEGDDDDNLPPPMPPSTVAPTASSTTTTPATAGKPERKKSIVMDDDDLPVPQDDDDDDDDDGDDDHSDISDEI